MRISANGGAPESTIKYKSRNLCFPQILPDGKSVLYSAAAFSTNQSSIMVQPLKSGEPKELFAGIGTRYLPTGNIVYATGNNLRSIWIPDGKRFLMIKGAGDTPSTGGGSRKINIVLNWTEELKQEVPAK